MTRRSSKARKHPKSHPQGILEVAPRGFGFVKTAEGEYFIPANERNGAFPGDLVLVARVGKRGDRQAGYSHAPGYKPSARVVKILSRANEHIIGRYEVAEPFGVVVPSDPRIPHDIFTLRKDNPSIEDGSLVEVEIVSYPSRNNAATGKVVRAIRATLRSI